MAYLLPQSPILDDLHRKLNQVVLNEWVKVNGFDDHGGFYVGPLCRWMWGREGLLIVNIKTFELELLIRGFLLDLQDCLRATMEFLSESALCYR